MKKLLLSLILVTSPVYAGLITHTDYQSNATITASGQNTNENTIVNEINGNLDSTNISAGGIATSNLSSAVQAQFVPTGTFFYFAGPKASIPAGYLYCDGTAVSRTTYALLFNVIGTGFGNGDNATTFNLPDTRGYFVRGMDDGTGRDPNAVTRSTATTGGNTGDNVGSVEGSTFTTHTHIASVTDPGHQHRIGISGGGASPATTDAPTVPGFTLTTPFYSTNSNLIQNTATGVTVANANTGASETRPININMVGIIKY